MAITGRDGDSLILHSECQTRCIASTLDQMIASCGEPSLAVIAQDALAGSDMSVRIQCELRLGAVAAGL